MAMLTPSTLCETSSIITLPGCMASETSGLCAFVLPLDMRNVINFCSVDSVFRH